VVGGIKTAGKVGIEKEKRGGRGHRRAGGIPACQSNTTSQISRRSGKEKKGFEAKI